MAMATDPTRTTTLRKNFLDDMGRRWRALGRALTKQIDRDDALGVRNERREWAFETDADKVKAFRAWLKEQIAAGILAIDETSGQGWLALYIASAYRRGVLRAYTDARPATRGPAFFLGGREEFIRQMFNAAEPISKLELLFTRAYDQLVGITEEMSGQMSRILAQGLADGKGPRQIARELVKRLDIPRERAMRLARTEIIYSHSEGQLDAFERLNVLEVGVLAEFATAGDNLVCPLCEELEGRVFTIQEARGIIPVHPNCRCTWIPYVPSTATLLRRRGRNVTVPAE